MHMGDALISPVVGGIMLAVTAGTLGYAIKKVQADVIPQKVALAGVTGAFVFAAQMINFSIPLTGSSGHLGGGLILAALLGPFWGYITLAAVLLTQALLFADGGLLAYGCNVFNMGFYACFLAYPLIYQRITQKGYSIGRIATASVLTSVIGLQLGAFSVVLETLLSGKTALPFGSFVLFMQPVHLAIGAVEGLISAAVISYVWKARPEILHTENLHRPQWPFRRVFTSLVLLTLVVGGFLSWFASSRPDGLEWSVANVAAQEIGSGLAETTASIQQNIAPLPDYGFRDVAGAAANLGTSLSGLVGGGVVLLLVFLVGYLTGLPQRKALRHE
jgi:cobalt/nickel transport system permease protein